MKYILPMNLVEVVVALVILAVGLLGVAAAADLAGRAMARGQVTASAVARTRAALDSARVDCPPGIHYLRDSTGTFALEGAVVCR